MQYIKYQEYLELGGVCDATAFNRYIDRVCAILDRYTYNRLTAMRIIPHEVKVCARDLVEFFFYNNSFEKTVASKSQSAGGVSESESYSIKSGEEIQLEVERIVFDYLNGLTDDYFTPLLYRGALK